MFLTAQHNATSSVPSPSKCTKIAGGWVFTPDPLQRSPDSLVGINGGEGKGGQKRGGKGERRGKGRGREEIDVSTGS